MKPTRLLIVSLSAVLSTAPLLAGSFTFAPFTGDADSGINPGITYTALADFNGTGARSVNGVLFNQSAAVGSNYSLTGASTAFNGFGNSVAGNANGLLSDFLYTGDGSGNASLTLTNLTIGQTYVTTWYNAGFGGPGGRNVVITPSDTSTPFSFDENYTGGGFGNLLRYTFTATSDTITYNFDAVSNGDSFHHYAFSNGVQNLGKLSTPIVSAAQGAGPGYSPFPVRNDDLLQTNLASVNSSGTFTLEGGGGVPILNNGTFLINGGNPADNTQLATAQNNSFVEFTLDTSINAFGYDISSIEVFGGWNDSGRDRQLFKVLYSLVGSPTFEYFGSADTNPAAGGTPSAVKTSFDAALTGVDAIRVEFFGGQENDHVGIGEIDVVGSATVPEPAAASLLLLGGLCAARRRRR